MPKVGGTSLRRIHAGPTVAKKGLEANASKPTGMPCSFSNVTVDSLPGLPETYDHVIKAPEPCQRSWTVPSPDHSSLKERAGVKPGVDQGFRVRVAVCRA